MRALELDYLRPGARSRLSRYALVVAAAAFTLHTAWYYAALSRDIGTKELLVAKRSAAAREAGRAPSVQVSADQYAFARDTVVRLATPWDSLFRALETAQIESVALLGIEPDAGQRTVTITGEAKDYLAALSYVASLSEQKALRNVHLVRHEPQRNAGPRPLAFTLSAAWSEPQ